MTPHRLVSILALGLVVTAAGMVVTTAGMVGAQAATPRLGATPITGGDPSTWTPVSVTPSSNNKVVKTVQGQSIVLNGFPATSIVESTNASVAAPIQGTIAEPTTVDGVTTPGATTNPGLQTSDVGAALVIVRDGPNVSGTASPITTFIVQVASVNGRDSMLDRKPLLLAGTEATLALNETGERLTWDLPRYRATSDNETVLASTGYPESRTLTAVGYGTANVVVTRGGKKLAKIVVTVARSPRFEFRVTTPRVIAAEAGQIVDITGRLTRRPPAGANLPRVCAFHVTPWTRLGCATLTPTGDFTIPAKAVPGTTVIEYREGGGKGSGFFTIEIKPAR